ncbi:hypothetical protein C8R46DRAFT_1027752 [Mycena filopes]|nr:hypothetical protein C8R46DRAFT_1027752 [Mycena filopes]
MRAEPRGKERGCTHRDMCANLRKRCIKKCTRCEAARERQEMYAVHTRGSARAQRETCTGRAHQGMYAARGCESSSMICASRDRRSGRERERMRATRTSGDVHGVRLREQRHDVRIERCARFTPNKKERERRRAMHTSRDVRGARLRKQRHDVRIERYAQSHPARERERLRATHTSRDVRDARLRKQRHDVRIERYAQFTPSEREREAAKAAARERREREIERWAEQVEVMHASRLDERDARRERYRPRCGGPERRGEARCAGTRTAPRRGKKNSSRDTISEDCVVSAHKDSTVESCEYSPTPGKPLKGAGQRRPRIVVLTRPGNSQSDETSVVLGPQEYQVWKSRPLRLQPGSEGKKGTAATQSRWKGRRVKSAMVQYSHRGERKEKEGERRTRRTTGVDEDVNGRSGEVAV